MPKGRPWTESEEQYLRAEYLRKTARQIAAVLSRTIGSTEKKLGHLKLRKGHHHRRRPWGELPIGTERVDCHGFTLLKIGPRTWTMKHRYLWAEHHGRKPTGSITFADGNRQNFAISNLVEISQRELLARNDIRRLPDDLRKLIHLKGNLTLMINNRRKKENE